MNPSTAATTAAAEVPSTNATTTTNAQSGIDIQKALDILADRSSCPAAHNHSHNHSHEDTNTEGRANAAGCQAYQTESLRGMGQTIDLDATAATTANNNNGNSGEDAIEVDEELQREQMAEQRKQRNEELQAHLRSMTIQELLETVLETQQQRVATYKEYNEYVPCCDVGCCNLYILVDFLL